MTPPTRPWLLAGIIGSISLISGTVCVAKTPARTCWISERTKSYVNIFPTESKADPVNPNHRHRPEMRSDDGQIIAAADFVLASDGWWINSVTGQSEESVPPDSDIDSDQTNNRVLIDYKHHQREIDRYSSVPCETAPAININNLLIAINQARANPTHYADEITTNCNHPTVLEAAAFLRQQHPLPPLLLHPVLMRSAANHAIDQGRSGSRSHVGTDGSTVPQRVEAAGLERPSLIGEEIAFNVDTPDGLALQLIVDEGVPDRGHRIILFNPDLVYAGIACEPHTAYHSVCVIDLSSRTTATGTEITLP